MFGSKEVKIDALSIGLFGLAVGATTLGLAQVGYISSQNALAVNIICLVFGGIVQILAGIVDIRDDKQMCQPLSF